MTFEEVYRRFKRPVWRLARRLTEGEEEALDATQEIFLRVWRGLDGWRGEATLSTWVFQIAWNYLRSLRRRRAQRGREVSLDPVDGAPETVTVPDPAPDPERRAGAAQLLGRIEGALGLLSEQHRTVIWLRDAEGLTYEEIAAVLDVPLGTVRSRLARARDALRRAVEG